MYTIRLLLLKSLRWVYSILTSMKVVTLDNNILMVYSRIIGFILAGNDNDGAKFLLKPARMISDLKLIPYHS